MARAPRTALGGEGIEVGADPGIEPGIGERADGLALVPRFAPSFGGINCEGGLNLRAAHGVGVRQVGPAALVLPSLCT